MKSIPEEIRNKVLILLDKGQSSPQIAKKLNLGHASVDRIRFKYRKEIKKPSSGRPSKLTSNDRRCLLRLVTSGKVDNAVKLTKHLNTYTGHNLIPQTIRNMLKKSGMKAIVKQKKPFLSAKHKRSRLEFALKYKYWTTDDWKRVVWTDEKKINRICSDGRQYAWIKQGRERNQENY